MQLRSFTYKRGNTADLYWSASSCWL